MHRRDQLLGSSALEQTRSAGTQGAEDIVVLLEGCQDQDCRSWGLWVPSISSAALTCCFALVADVCDVWAITESRRLRATACYTLCSADRAARAARRRQ